jgi:TolA-binding protein
MRKKITALILLTMLLPAGCGEGTYGAERRFWQANNRLQRLLSQSDKDTVIKTKEFDDLLFAFKEIVMRYPFWRDTPRANFVLANLYLMKNDRKSARKEYEYICENYPQNAEYCAEALKDIGVLYEQENNWAQAESMYKKIIEKYPYSSIGLIIPLNLAQQYKKRQESEKATDAFQQALSFYNNLIEKHPNSPGAVAAVDLAVACVLNLKGAEPAVVFLKELINKHAHSVIESQSIFDIARIYNFEMGNRSEAIKYYQQIVTQYPQSDLAEKAQQEIEKLTK